MMKQLKWATARIIFILLSIAGLLSFGILGFILLPVYSWYFFGHLFYRNYIGKIYPVIFTSVRILSIIINDQEYRRIFSIPVTAPPMMDPDLSKVRVKSTWPIKDGTCNGCVKCCTKLRCIFMDSEENRCMSYGSFYWRYFNCGRYPSYERQIRYYQCEKWEEV